MANVDLPEAELPNSKILRTQLPAGVGSDHKREKLAGFFLH